MQKSKKSPVSYVSILLYDDSGNFLLFYSRSADSPSPGLSKLFRTSGDSFMGYVYIVDDKCKRCDNPCYRIA